MKWLVFFLIIGIELHGQKSSSINNYGIEFSDSTISLTTPQNLNQNHPIWYYPPFPTLNQALQGGFCLQAGNTWYESKCVTFTIPNNILSCGLLDWIWASVTYPEGTSYKVTFATKVRNSLGQEIPFSNGFFQVNAGETYTLCATVRADNSSVKIFRICPMPILVPTEFKIKHSLIDPFKQTTQSINLFESSKEGEFSAFGVCADGSLSNFEFSFDNSIGGCPDYFRLRIKEDPSGQTPDLYGKLKNFKLNSNGFSFDYEHPKSLPIYESNNHSILYIEVYEISSNKSIKEIPLKVYRTPVLMVHGLWSNDGAFSPMYKSFLSSGRYSDFQVFRADYEKNNGGPFNSNSLVVPSAIDKLKSRALFYKVACGKIDIIGHSMGGLLTRLYLQSTFTPYRDDISRIITLNSPHAGAQLADLLLDKNYKYHEIIQELVNIVKGDPNGGAIDNLRVEGNAINNVLNGYTLNKNKVPSHAIITLRDFPPIPKNVPLIVKNPWLKVFFTLINFVGEVVEDMENAFGSEKHDWIVPESSQIGGIKGITSVTTYTDINHIESTESSKVISRVLELLAQPINSQYFSNFGYQPPSLDYNTPLPLIPNSNQAERSETPSLTINSPVQGSSVISGRPFTINITGTNDIKEMRIIISSKSDSIIYLEHTGNSFNLNFQSELPSGVTKILALGKSSNNQIVYKSVNIKVCKSDIYLNNDILSSKEYYADRNIFSNSLITDQSSVRLISGNSITLNPGFEARFGTSLSAKIETCQTVNNGTSINNTDQVDKSEFFLSKENELLVKPNPFSNSAVAEFEINEEQMVSLVLIDSNGKIVKQIFNGQLYEGTHKVEFNNFGLKSGIYFLRFSSRIKVITKKVVLF